MKRLLLGVAVFAASGFVGDAALLPLLRRIDGPRLLRWSAVAALVAYSGFLAAGSVTTKGAKREISRRGSRATTTTPSAVSERPSMGAPSSYSAARALPSS